MRLILRVNIAGTRFNEALTRLVSQASARPIFSKDKYQTPVELIPFIPTHLNNETTQGFKDKLELPIEGTGNYFHFDHPSFLSTRKTCHYGIRKPSGIATVAVDDKYNFATIFYVGEHFTFLDILSSLTVKDTDCISFVIKEEDRFVKDMTAKELFTPVFTTALHEWENGNGNSMKRLITEYIERCDEDYNKPIHPEVAKAWAWFNDTHAELAKKHDTNQKLLQGHRQATGRHRGLIKAMVMTTPNKV